MPSREKYLLAELRVLAALCVVYGDSVQCVVSWMWIEYVCRRESAWFLAVCPFVMVLPGL